MNAKERMIFRLAMASSMGMVQCHDADAMRAAQALVAKGIMRRIYLPIAGVTVFALKGEGR